VDEIKLRTVFQRIHDAGIPSQLLRIDGDTIVYDDTLSELVVRDMRSLPQNARLVSVFWDGDKAHVDEAVCIPRNDSLIIEVRGLPSVCHVYNGDERHIGLVFEYLARHKS
jgi:hypothetical protein